ncbi:MAG: efflux transporter outer membrane subunit [Novosphingobium meiothermophilum]
MIPSARHRHALPLLALVLGACTAGPDYVAPELPVAPAWRAPVNGGAAPKAPWWEAFGDPVLARLEREALAGNLSVEQALARLDQARATLRGTGAARLPAAEAGATAARAQQSLNAGIGQLSRFVPDLPRTVNNGAATISASWDLDLAGGLRRREEAARAGLAEAAAGVAAARLAVSAELAAAYFRLRVAEAQHRAVAALVDDARLRERIGAARLGAGAASLAEQERLSALAEQAAASLPDLAARIEQERSQIAVLSGHSPSLPPDLAGGFAFAAPDPLAGVPAAVLAARPDVAAAEARLIAANAGIGAALAEYWPSLSISGLLGLQSNVFGNLVSGDSVAVQGAAGLRWRLFDFGRIDAQVKAARGRTREMLAAYRETVLRATADVETAHAALAASHEALARAEAETALSRKAHARDAAAFRTGAISRDALSLSASALAQSELRLAAARGQRALAVVAAARALALPVD